MPVAYIMVAVCSGLTTALIWLFLDGAWWSAFLVYVLTGNLMIAAMVVRAIFRDEDRAAMPSDDERPPATEA